MASAQRSAGLRFNLPLIVGLVGVFGLTLVVFLAPVIFAMDPLKINSGSFLLKPVPFDGSSWRFPLGTDQLGRDTLARLMHGGRATLIIAWSSVLLAGSIGAIIGLLSGYFEGRLDAFVMRIAEAIMAFPMVILALLLVSATEPGPASLIGVFTFVGWPHFAKIVRGGTIALKHEEYVIAPRALGARDLRIIFRHLLPNVFPLFAVMVPLQISTIVYAEAGLSFIGVGIQPPDPSWGAMLSDGRNYIMVTPWLITWPGVALLITVLGANLLGDSLQDRFNPRRQGG